MGTAILTRTIELYWAFCPVSIIVDHQVMESWQWRFCWDLAAHIEQERMNAALQHIRHG